MTQAIIERLQRLSIPEPNTGCWIWLGHLNKVSGYGTIGIRINGSLKTRYAHRISYEEFLGPIPEGLQIDHLCRVRCCVNPDHLEPVTRSENLLRSPLLGKASSRKTHCPRGHSYSGTNSRGARVCNICNRIRLRADRQKAARAKLEEAQHIYDRLDRCMVKP